MVRGATGPWPLAAIAIYEPEDFPDAFSTFAGVPPSSADEAGTVRRPPEKTPR